MDSNPEIESLKATRDNLQASIAAREKTGRTGDFLKVTNLERTRLQEVEAALAALLQTPPAADLPPAL